MKLTELKPEWSDEKTHLKFACPTCGGNQLYIPVAKIDPEDRPWTMTGDNFENITLSPSIDFRHYDPGKPRSTDPNDTTNCHAHFFIRNGEIQLA